MAHKPFALFTPVQTAPGSYGAPVRRVPLGTVFTPVQTGSGSYGAPVTRSGAGYAPSPIGTAPSSVTGRPTTIYVNMVAALPGHRIGQRLTTAPVAYVPSVSIIGTGPSSGGAAIGESIAGAGGLPWRWIALALALLVAGAYVFTRK